MHLTAVADCVLCWCQLKVENRGVLMICTGRIRSIKMMKEFHMYMHTFQLFCFPVLCLSFRICFFVSTQ